MQFLHGLSAVFCSLVVVVLANSDTETTDLKKEIAQLKHELALQSSRIVALEQYDKILQEKERLQSSKLVNLEQIVQDLRGKLNNDTPSVESPYSIHDSDKGSHRLPRSVQDSHANVAFYAYKSSSFSNIGAYRTMIYDTVITNVGGGYNRHTGIFTAPSQGVYAFAWVIIASGRNPIDGRYGDQFGEISIELLHNGVNRGSIHADSEQSADDDSATGFAILNLQPNDSVYLRSTYYAYNQGSFISTREQGRSSFSGFRIAPNGLSLE